MDCDTHLKRLKFRAWHRGTREADMLVGGYFDRYAAEWDAAGRAWFAALLEEQDIDIVSWAMGTAAPPARLAGAQMDALLALGYLAPAR